MMIDQLAPFLQGSFFDGVARTMDISGRLGVLDDNLILDQFGPSAIRSDLDAINRDAAKCVGMLFGDGGE